MDFILFDPVKDKMAAVTITWKSPFSKLLLLAPGVPWLLFGNKSSFLSTETGDGVKITNRNLKTELTNGLHELWKNSLLCDVVLMSKGISVKAHRVVLAINSDYFRAMFTSGLQESAQTVAEISLDEVPSDIVKEIVAYMYNGTMQVSKENVSDVIVACDLLQMDELKAECCQVMANNTDVSNCIGVWQFADQFHCSGVREKAFSIIKQQFSIVCLQEEFLSLCPEILKSILQCDDLNLGRNGEDVVVQCLCCWMKQNEDLDTENMKDVLQLVRFNHVSREKMDSLMALHIIQNNPELKLCIERSLEKNWEPRSYNKCIYVMGGYLQSRIGPLCPRLQSVTKYSVNSGKWTAVCDLPVLPSFVYSFTLFEKLLCIAFEMNKTNSGPAISNISTEKGGLYEYDQYKNSWKGLSYLFSASNLSYIKECILGQGAFATCPDTNRLFLVTFSGPVCLHLALQDGDIICEDTTHFPAIERDCDETIYGSAAVTLNRSLYVLGGQRRYSRIEMCPMNNVYKLDSVLQEWTPIQPMNNTRSSCAAVSLGGHIYALGGFDVYRLSSVERYDPTADQWTYIQKMASARSNLNAVVLHGKIYAMGGKSYGIAGGGVRKVLRSVEVYDPDLDEWTSIESMPQNRCMFGAVVF